VLAVSYHFRMKSAVAFCVLCAIPAWPQNVPPTVQTGSRVASVTIQSVGQGNGEYKFSIKNASAQSVTAFDVLLVPDGVVKKNGRFICGGKCSESRQIDTIDKPAIKAGGTADVTYEIAKVKGGAVILEAVIFADASYAGNERAAAYLVAEQLGDQEEFDRIVPAMGNILAGAGSQNAGKADRVYTELAALPVDADSTMIETFDRWFPNLRDCGQRFPLIMKGASVKLGSYVQGQLQPLLSREDASGTALTQWWKTTQQYLAGFGCSQCAAAMASPNPPVRLRTISVGCKGQTASGAAGTVLSAEMADDAETDDADSDSDTADAGSPDAASPDNSADQSAANAADSGDSSGQGAADDQLVMTPEPAAPTIRITPPAATASNSASAVAPSVSISGSTSISTSVASSSRCLPMAPGRFAFGGVARPMTDEQVYPRYFLYVKRWDECLAGDQWPASKVEEFPDPYPAGMNENQRKIVTLIAYEWEKTPREPVSTMGAPGTATAPGFAPEMTWARMQELMQRRRQMADARDERARLVETQVNNLRLQLGKTSFHGLDDYVHELFHAIPGRLVREPLTEFSMYSRYLHYIASLDKFAANGGEDGKEAARARDVEQEACWLSDKEEGILQHVAEDFQKDIKEHPPRPVPGAVRVAGDPAINSVGQAAPSTPFAEERKRIIESHIAQLKSDLGEAGFKKIEKRARALYESDGPGRVIAVDALETESKAATSPTAAP
jgi:hypothetical protein